jgi:hypothetical protein
MPCSLVGPDLRNRSAGVVLNAGMRHKVMVLRPFSSVMLRTIQRYLGFSVLMEFVG